MKKFLSISLLALSLCSAISCTKEPFPGDPKNERRIMIYYGCGYNNLSSSLREDVGELCDQAPTWEQENYYKLLLFCHTSRTDNDWTTPVSPVLIDAYKDENGNIVRDTIKVFPENSVSASTEMLKEVLTYIKDSFPAKSYGFVFSSHGTGWLPQGYYADSSDDSYFTSLTRRRDDNSGTYIEGKPSSYRDSLPGPLVKSIGAQFVRSSRVSREMEITDFAKAFPMYMEYVVLDACLMGGVEMACELKGHTDYVVSSQTEIMSDGMEYENMLNRLLYPDKADLKGLCEDYYTHCLKKGNGATVSLVDCNKLGVLCTACSEIFSKDSAKIADVKASSVQRYFREDKHWFYDLRDICYEAGVPSERMASLDAALGECVLYKVATNYFLTIPIKNHCGLSMYLPNMGSAVLDKFYKDFAWNEETLLVK